MGRFIDLTGKQFGRLTVISRAENAQDGATKWHCVCSCGNIRIVRGKDLKNGKTKSCGCYNHEITINRNRKYKHTIKTYRVSETKLYMVWCSLKQRCLNGNNKSYINYGGRGITVCDEWKNDFKAFYDWALNNGYKEGLTIERINVNGNYCPKNCMWIPKGEQNRNTRRNVKYLGLCQSEWNRNLGLHCNAIAKYRFRHKCDLEFAVEYFINRRLGR